MQSVERDDDALDDPFLSLDIFRSLAAYDRDLPFAAEYEHRCGSGAIHAPIGSRNGMQRAALLEARWSFTRIPRSPGTMSKPALRDCVKLVLHVHADSIVQSSPKFIFGKSGGVSRAG